LTIRVRRIKTVLLVFLSDSPAIFYISVYTDKATWGFGYGFSITEFLRQDVVISSTGG
jgi:hypothetical protein